MRFLLVRLFHGIFVDSFWEYNFVISTLCMERYPYILLKMFDLEFQMIFYSRSPPHLFIQKQKKGNWNTLKMHDLLFCWCAYCATFFFSLTSVFIFPLENDKNIYANSQCCQLFKDVLEHHFLERKKGFNRCLFVILQDAIGLAVSAFKWVTVWTKPETEKRTRSTSGLKTWPSILRDMTV